MSRQLEKFRRQLDKIDEKMLKILADRFKITKKVGEYKARYYLPICDKKRESEILKNRRLLAKKLKLNEKLVKEIFEKIIKTVRANHQEIKNKLKI